MLEGEYNPLQLPAPETKPLPQLEIKPKNPGILKDNLINGIIDGKGYFEATSDKEKLDYLLVFGQGPVLDENTKTKPVKSENIVKTAPIAWMKNVARATGELYRAGSCKKIILTGGRTGGDNNKSEAELMKEILVNEYKIPGANIIMEDKSTNTLENIAFSLNEIDLRKTDSQIPKIGFMGTDFQLPRIRTLAHLYNIVEHKSFSAEQIFRLIARKTNDETLHQQLDAILSMEDDLSFPESRFLRSETLEEFQENARASEQSKSTRQMPTLFEEQIGEEKIGYRKKRIVEEYLTRGLVELPEYWFGYLYHLNDQRLELIINQTDQEVLDRFGIKKKMDAKRIKEILEPYTKSQSNDGKRPSLDQFYGIKGTEDEKVIDIEKVASGKSSPESINITETKARIENIMKDLNRLGNG